MKNRTILLSAAAFAVANLSLVSIVPQTLAQQDPAGQSTGAGASGASDQSSGLSGSRSGTGAMSDVAQSDRDQINRTLAQAVKDAVQPGKFNDLVNCLCKQDRDRIQAQKPDTTQLDTTAKALGESWKSKFGQDFDISDEKASFASFVIMNGESAEARTAGATMGPGASSGGPSAGAPGSVSGGTSGAGTSGNASGGTSGGTSGGSSYGAGQSSQGQAQQASAQEGQKAHLMIPASHGLPEVTVNLVKEGGDWKLDIPDNIDANQLSQNLQNQLSQAQSMQSRWPSDQSRAQAAIAHHVILALEGKSASGTGAGGSSGTGSSGYGTGTSGSGTSGSSGTSGTGTDSGSNTGTGTGR